MSSRNASGISYAVPEADAITAWGMVDQSGRGWDFRQVKTKVHRKSRKHGGQSGNVASERSIVFFREIPVLVEAETILRHVSVDGAFEWNVRYGIVPVYEPERRLARVRKKPVAELLIATPWTPMRAERNIRVRESAFGEAALPAEAEQVLRKFLDGMSSFMINRVEP